MYQNVVFLYSNMMQVFPTKNNLKDLDLARQISIFAIVLEVKYQHLVLSFDVYIIHLIKLCHKNGMTTCNHTLVHTHNFTDKVYVNNAFSYLLMFILKAINPILKGHIINRILPSWSFHMKFMELAKGSFYKCPMK